MSASLPEPVARLLGRAGLASAGARELSGGVSSEIWQVGAVCVKRALPRLRVAQVWEAPVERNRYERLWLEAAAAAVPGAAPRVIAWEDGFFVMEYLDAPVWKSLLARGEADPAFAAQVGERLAAIHAATAGREDVARRFPTDDIFHAIRLEPYLVASARTNPDLAGTLHSLVERTASTKQCLVHGDVSPKNILVAKSGPVFLDAECAWYGDPAFDLAFCLNHLLLKGVWVPSARERFLACFDALSTSYLKNVRFEGVEARTAALLPALLLARVDGKSPVEYLSAADRERVRNAARGFLKEKPGLQDIRKAWQRSST